MTGHDDDHAAACRQPAAHVRQGCLGVTAVGRGGPDVGLRRLVVEPERRQAQPGVAQCTGLVVGVVEGAERGGPKVHRRFCAGGGSRP